MGAEAGHCEKREETEASGAQEAVQEAHIACETFRGDVASLDSDRQGLCCCSGQQYVHLQHVKLLVNA